MGLKNDSDLSKIFSVLKYNNPKFIIKVAIVQNSGFNTDGLGNQRAKSSLVLK